MGTSANTNAPEPQTCEPVPEHHRQDAVVERAQARALDDVVEDMHRERWRETRRRREGSSERRGRELGEPRRRRRTILLLLLLLLLLRARDDARAGARRRREVASVRRPPRRDDAVRVAPARDVVVVARAKRGERRRRRRSRRRRSRRRVVVVEAHRADAAPQRPARAQVPARQRLVGRRRRGAGRVVVVVVVVVRSIRRRRRGREASNLARRRPREVVARRRLSRDPSVGVLRSAPRDAMHRWPWVLTRAARDGAAASRRRGARACAPGGRAVSTEGGSNGRERQTSGIETCWCSLRCSATTFFVFKINPPAPPRRAQRRAPSTLRRAFAHRERPHAPHRADLSRREDPRVEKTRARGCPSPGRIESHLARPRLTVD